MSGIPLALLTHSIGVEQYLATTGDGVPIYGSAITVACFLDDQTRLTRSTLTGDEVTSTATAYAARSDAPYVNVNARVTLPSGRVTTVLAVLDRNGGGLATPDHLEILLT